MPKLDIPVIDIDSLESAVNPEFIEALQRTRKAIYDWGKDRFECESQHLSGNDFIISAAIDQVNAEVLTEAVSNAGIELEITNIGM